MTARLSRRGLTRNRAQGVVAARTKCSAVVSTSYSAALAGTATTAAGFWKQTAAVVYPPCVEPVWPTSRATDQLVAAEARRTRRSKSAVVSAFTEETARTRRFPGIGFRGDDAARRAWVIGSGLDVWEVVQMLDEFGGVQRLLAETQLTERQVRLALAYREAYPTKSSMRSRTIVARSTS